MNILEYLLNNRTIAYDKLISLGFTKSGNNFLLRTQLIEDTFDLVIQINSSNQISTKVVELLTDEEYTLLYNPQATGEYVGKLKEAYVEKLTLLLNQCCIEKKYDHKITESVIQYIFETYGDEPEFLWKSTPKNSIFRHKENQKWYAAILTVEKRKLGIDEDGFVEILDLKGTLDQITKLIDYQKYFPGYHMNKKSWFTILLDGSVPLNEIIYYIDTSHKL